MVVLEVKLGAHLTRTLNKLNNKMKKEISVTLSKSEIELIQDSLAIAESHLRQSELGKTMAIDLKILKDKIKEQIKCQVKK